MPRRTTSRAPGAPRASRSMPRWVEPMLAMLSSEAEFDATRARSKAPWIVERKVDGFRALCYRDGASVRLLSRNQKDLGGRFPEVVEAVRRQPLKQFIIDGEVVAVEGSGSRARVSFEKLQQRLKPIDLASALRSGVRLEYHVFDLLFAHDSDVRSLPLLDRRKLLRKAIRFNDRIRLLRHWRAGGGRSVMTLEQACRRGWEGLIAKDASGPYGAGRSRSWLKLKCDNRQEFVIGGYTDPAGSRIGFGALLVGYFDGGRLRYAGRVGTGYSDELLRTMSAQFAKMEVDQRPFEPDPELPRKNVHWVPPKLVAEIAFTEWTGEGKLRHPRFLGLRPDKSAREVVREAPPLPKR